MDLRKKRMGARYDCGCLEQKEVTLIKPQTFMNESGLSVSAWLSALRLEPSGLIVVHDDLDLSLFHIRIKRGGNHGGHRGVSSIIKEIASPNFVRIRIGIGRPAEDISAADYVLQRFSAVEAEDLPEAIRRGADAALAVIQEGLEAAMNRFNARSKRAIKPLQSMNHRRT
jgi:PTH1 family peptidyl-tRNA hydrolase